MDLPLKGKSAHWLKFVQLLSAEFCHRNLGLLITEMWHILLVKRDLQTQVSPYHTVGSFKLKGSGKLPLLRCGGTWKNLELIVLPIGT